MEDHSQRFYGRPHSHRRAPRGAMMYLLISALLINGTRPTLLMFRARSGAGYQG
jgi:hypothetical protein